MSVNQAMFTHEGSMIESQAVDEKFEWVST